MWALTGVFPKRNEKRRKPQWTSPSFPLLPPPQITVKRPVLAKAAFPGGFFLPITPFLNSDKTHNSKSICIWYIRIQGHPSQTLISKRQCQGSKASLNPQCPGIPNTFHSKSHRVPWPPVEKHWAWHQPATVEQGLGSLVFVLTALTEQQAHPESRPFLKLLVSDVFNT